MQKYNEQAFEALYLSIFKLNTTDGVLYLYKLPGRDGDVLPLLNGNM